MSGAAPAANPGETLPGWAFSHVDAVRYADLDAMRHLNNVTFLQFFESARIAYVTSIVPSHRPTAPEDDWGLIFAECHINYRAPAFFGEPIACECRVSWATRSAFGLEYRVVSDGGPLGPARLIADGSTVQVMFDLKASRVTRVPPELLTAIEAFEGRAIPRTRPGAEAG